uniref:Uncharacterized protein n=1 Tax=anatid alphaherpesvirus 1 TaxID=104388 RepID=A0A516T830_9ALPH|nr:hypothetical protein [Anatid alphaherpesvirus 1]QDQ37254.1 hypothetical protein [Anatid alphaherpesvirus 1]QDQ37259.1 hypothetical protein [Anatid alphaherpesvirus 1]QDQ37262.1 hypothetical protein [Anatid alphaherpesvirus 1]QDQ37268.1 hypothetical protein [Anatid alphaherpesvirus 1]
MVRFAYPFIRLTQDLRQHLAVEPTLRLKHTILTMDIDRVPTKQKHKKWGGWKAPGSPRRNRTIANNATTVEMRASPYGNESDGEYEPMMTNHETWPAGRTSTDITSTDCLSSVEFESRTYEDVRPVDIVTGRQYEHSIYSSRPRTTKIHRR